MLYTTKAQFQKDKSNLKLLTNKDPNNYSSVQMKKRTKKRTAVSTNDEMNTVSNYNYRDIEYINYHSKIKSENERNKI